MQVSMWTCQELNYQLLVPTHFFPDAGWLQFGHSGYDEIADNRVVMYKSENRCY